VIHHLAERLDVPLRDRNRLLLAARFAPVFGERSLGASEMAPVREALERSLTAHEHHPAVVVDRHWNIAAWNRGVAHVTRGVALELRTPPAKALRIALQSDGLAPRISNLADGERLAARAAPPRDRSDGRSRLEALYQELVA
jgi:hypothetical protein